MSQYREIKKVVEGKRSHEIHMRTKHDFPVVVPVIDVRDSEEARKAARQMQRNSNSKSKYMVPTFGSGGGSYQSSPKNK